VSALTVIVITKNEENNIRCCLETVRWADEIIIVDANSSDRTVEIAKEYTSKVFIRPWDGYGAAKNFGLAQCSNEWVFWLDADERVTPELRREIENSIASANAEIAAISMPRKANFLGHWIRHCGWYPGRVTRVFRRSEGKFTAANVHERLEINGNVLALNRDLLHYTDPTLTVYFEKLNKYTSLAAKDLVENNRRFTWLRLVINPCWVFIRMYILQLGFLDGIPGLILCTLSASHVFAKYAKLWEYANHK
jgi:(heptosyl)LPS beta-1,4-glucosyltransferase